MKKLLILSIAMSLLVGLKAQMQRSESAPMPWRQSAEKVEGLQVFPLTYNTGGSSNYVPSKKQKSDVTYTPFGSYIRSTDYAYYILGESGVSFSPAYNYDLSTVTLFPDSLTCSQIYITDAPSSSYKRAHFPAIGYVFDPYSVAFDMDFQYGLFENSQTGEICGYSIDTLAILGDYRIANYNPSSPDTLRVFLSYYNAYRYPYNNPDPRNGNEYFSLASLMGWARLILPIVEYDDRNNIAQKGPVTKPAATNTVTIDYILSNKDSINLAPGYFGYRSMIIPVKNYIGNNFEVPAGSVTSVVMKFIPGYNYNNGDTIRKTSYNSKTSSWVAEEIRKNLFSSFVVNNTQDYEAFLDEGGGVNGRLMENQDVRYDKNTPNKNATWNPNHHSMYDYAYYAIPCVYMVLSTGDNWWDPTLSAPAYTIQGSVKVGGNPLSGIKVISSNGDVATTDASGNYIVRVDSNATVTITPILTPNSAKYTFSPQSITCSNVKTNLNNQNFIAIPYPKYTIKGSINFEGSPLAGVTISCTNGTSATTDLNGEYTITVDSNETVTLTPSMSGYNFKPLSITCTKVATNLTEQDFTAVLPLFTIKGRVTCDGNPLPGVTIKEDYSGFSTTTDANGDYVVEVEMNSDALLTPSLGNYVFKPTARKIPGVICDFVNQDFTTTNVGIATIPNGNSSIRIYPNPAKNELRVIGSEVTKLQSYEIYSVVGQIVLQGTLRNSTINVESLASGMYFLKINGKTARFVKE